MTDARPIPPAPPAARLLELLLTIAVQALEPSAGVTVPYTTLLELQAEVVVAGRRPAASAEERLIGDECEMLLKCLLNAELHRLDGAVARAVRWQTLARCFLPFLRTDLARAGAAVPAGAGG